MNRYRIEAMTDFDAAVSALKDYTADNTDFEVEISVREYPLRFTFSPKEDADQESLFETDSEGVVGEITVIYSSGGAGVDLGLKCHIQADVLKKLIKLCAACGEAYLHAFKAKEAGE